MESTALLRNLRIAPRKVRIIADIVRGQPIEKALATLRYTPKAASKPVEKLLCSAIANAEQRSNGQLDIDQLVVKTIYVDQGPTMRRFMPRAQGRATRIRKRTSHVTVVLSDR
ncbi:MAG: 50S ribosomal protein L22 [Myxococcales bacterium]|jgi:large subunit ribosomal protein L22|nr:50S ribosomal protein L22 [Myxococcales bacterium]